MNTSNRSNTSNTSNTKSLIEYNNNNPRNKNIGITNSLKLSKASKHSLYNKENYKKDKDYKKYLQELKIQEPTTNNEKQSISTSNKQEVVGRKRTPSRIGTFFGGKKNKSHRKTKKRSKK